MRTFPPYARTIARYAARGVRPVAVGVMLSERWFYFENVARVCIKPADWKPGRWEFDYLRNQHVVAIWGDGAETWQVGELLVELMAVGPRLLWLCDTAGRWIYKGDEPSVLYEYATHTIRGEVPYAQWPGPRMADHRPALEAYRAGQRRAIDEEGRISGRAAERSGDEGLVKVYNAMQAELARVERLFSDPLAEPDERAA